MAKPYDFESPLATEKTIQKVADIIKTNYPNNETFESLQAEFETFTGGGGNLSEYVKKTVADSTYAKQSDLNTLLTTLNNWV